MYFAHRLILKTLNISTLLCQQHKVGHAKILEFSIKHQIYQTIATVVY